MADALPACTDAAAVAKLLNVIAAYGMHDKQIGCLWLPRSMGFKIPRELELLCST